MSKNSQSQDFLEKRKVKKGKRRINTFWLTILAIVILGGIGYVGFTILPPYQTQFLYALIGSGPSEDDNSAAQEAARPQTSLPPSNMQ